MLSQPGTTDKLIRCDAILSGSWSDKAKKAVATHSSTVACKIPWAEWPGRLQSMGSLRVGHD